MQEVKIEGVYYSNPFPRSFAAITVLGLVFDRIHLPFVSLTDEGFTVSEIQNRIDGLVELAQGKDYYSRNTATMISALQFTWWKEWTKDFIVYPHSTREVWDATKKIPDALVKEIYDLTFPPRENFIPTFDSLNSFSIVQGEDASIEYPGQFHYSAGAYLYATSKKLPLINDIQMLGVPNIKVKDLKYDASTLASVLAVECIKFILPQVPLLDITELLDFRDRMAPYTKPFRISLIKIAGLLNQELEGISDFNELSEAAQFIIETEIQPQLIELKEFAESPLRPWYKNILKVGKPLAAQLSSGFWSVPLEVHMGKVLKEYFSLSITDEVTRKQKDKIIKRNPLYYLLQIEQLGK